ncbi:MAG: 4-(cytidine 5'-diphospho)-2-C-methyl-D-erythritol kinase [Pseudomonadota bacterium]
MTASGAPGEFWLSAPAKLNLYLHVLGERDDGYHLLNSLVAFAGLRDELVFRPDDTLSLSIRGPFAPALEEVPLEENLVLRAARRLAEAIGVRQGAAITLVKNLPVAGGIGGGSADAAATLRGLIRLWGVAWEPGLLGALGLALGADVPVCLAGQAAFLGGIGEELTPAGKLPEAGLVLVNPGVALSTAAVFRAHGKAVSEAAPIRSLPGDAEGLAEFLKARRNDLTEAALRQAPVVGEALEEIAGTAGCLLARMSGSGATCFGLYRDLAAAKAAAAALRRRPSGWWIAATTFLAG